MFSIQFKNENVTSSQRITALNMHVIAELRIIDFMNVFFWPRDKDLASFFSFNSLCRVINLSFH